MKEQLHPLTELSNGQAPVSDPPVRSQRRIFQVFTWLFRHWLWFVLGIVLALGIAWVMRPTPVVVETHTLELGLLQETVNAEGKTRIQEQFTIAADVSGHLARIDLETGDPVSVGTLVAQIDPLPLNTSIQEALGRLAAVRAQRAGVDTQRPKPAALAQAAAQIEVAIANHQAAQARVAQAEAALNQARRDSQRVQDLYAEGAVSRQSAETAELTEVTRVRELEAAKRDAQAAASLVTAAKNDRAALAATQSDPDYLLRVYDGQIASIEAELARLQDDAKRTNIYSPVRGKVLRVLQESAQFVQEGTPLLEIGNPADLELVIDVLSRDAERIQPNAPILIDQGEGNPPLTARVQRIEPSAFTEVSALGVEEQRVNIIGRFIDPSAPFGDAYRVDAKIVTWQDPDALKLPLSALFRCDLNWCVFVVEADQAQRLEVQIGHRSDREAEVKQGLHVGDIVILHPSEQLQPGTTVTIQ